MREKLILHVSGEDLNAWKEYAEANNKKLVDVISESVNSHIEKNTSNVKFRAKAKFQLKESSKEVDK